MLLNLADHAHHDGRNSWPAVRTIAAETSLTRRAVQKILPRLLNKGFIVAEGKMARGSIRYALDLGALDRERYSQSEPSDREPRSQTAHVNRSAPSGDCEPYSPHGEPGSPGGANHVRGGGEPGSPDPSLNRHSEPSEKKSSLSRSLTHEERSVVYPRLRALAVEVVSTQRTATDEELRLEVARRADAEGIDHDDHTIAMVVAFSKMNVSRYGARRRA